MAKNLNPKLKALNISLLHICFKPCSFSCDDPVAASDFALRPVLFSEGYSGFRITPLFQSLPSKSYLSLISPGVSKL